MRIRRLTPVLVVVLLAACSGGGGAASTAKPSAAGQAPTTKPADTAAPAANGSVDCTAVKAALADLIVPIQLMAQVKDPPAVEAMKAGTIGPKLDPDKILADLHALHALDGVASPLGDPKAAIASYEDAANALKTLFAASPVTQDAIDAYNKHVGELTAFLMHQAAISGAMDGAHC